MQAYILRRLLALIPTLLFASLIVFVAVRWIPGDVVDLMMSQNDIAADQDRERIEQALGLDQPVLTQYLSWVADALRGDDLIAEPLHPYTEALLAAVPIPDPELETQRPRAAIEGEIPSAMHPPSGCHFHPRCPKAMAECRRIAPELVALGEGRSVSCHLHGDSAATGATP